MLKKDMQYSIFVSSEMQDRLEAVKGNVYGDMSRNAMLNDLIRRGLSVAEQRTDAETIRSIPTDK